MKYNRLGRAGIKVSELSFGSWLTFGDSLDVKGARTLMKLAFDAGVNFFDNAETYGQGQSEIVMGEALKDFRRSDLVISTKIYFGCGRRGPNDTGLSWKHLVEGTGESLKRLQLDYVDLLFCHRPDEETPIAETVRAMDHLVRSGRAFYWGTSEWSAEQITEAYEIADELCCIPPTMEQPQYNLLARARVEEEYESLYVTYGLGTTIWSPLASGLLTGKYNDGIPSGTRLSQQEWLRERVRPEAIAAVRELGGIAKSLGCSMAQLAIAWCLCHPRVSTVILGATTEKQLRENLAAAAVREKLTDDVLHQIRGVLAKHGV